MDKIRNIARYNFRVILYLSILLLVFQNNNVLAKSTNKDDFIKLFNKAQNLEKEKKDKEAYLLRLKLENDFDVEKLKIANGVGGKGDFYFSVCHGARQFNRSENRIKELIYFCNKSYEYYEKSNTFKTVKGYDFIESYLDDMLSFNHAWYFQFNGNKESEIKAEKHALKLLKYKNSKTEKFFYNNGLKALATINRSKGKNKEAIKHMKELIKSLECNNKSKISVICYGERQDLAALLQSEDGGISESKKIYDELIHIEKKIPNLDNTIKAAVRSGVSNYYELRKNFEQAEKYLYEALSFLDPENPTSTEMYFMYKSRHFGLMDQMGFQHEAKIGYEKLINDIRETYGVHSVQLIEPLSRLIMFYIIDKNKSKLTNELNNLIKTINENKNYKYNLEPVYAHIAHSYTFLKKHSKAEKYLIKASNGPRKDDGITFAFIANNIHLKKYSDAEKKLKKIKINNNNKKISYYEAYSKLYYETKEIEKYKKIFVNYYSTLSNYSKGFIKTDETAPINYYALSILKLLDGLTNLPEEEYKIVAKHFQQEKGQTIENAIIELFEISRSSKINTRIQNLIDRSKDSEVSKEKRKLQDLIIEFEKISKITNDETQEKKLFKELKTSKTKITNQKKIVLKKLNLTNFSNFSEEISLNDIQKNLTEDQGIISYFIDPFSLYILTITKEDFQIKKIKITNKKIKDHIKEIMNTVKVDDANKLKKFNFDNASKLYDIVLKPIENLIKDKKDLIIIPHKALMSLPFGILTKDKIKQSNKIEYQKVNWLGKQYSISYYPSIYSFYNLQKIKSKNNENNFAGFGDPEFNSKKEIKLASKSDLSNLTMSRGVADADEIRKLSELPETSDELKFIANIFKGKSKLYLRKDFDEEKIKSLDLSNYKYISFATHAIVADQINNISEPGIILTPPKKSTKTNDGILTVSEIERLKLNSDVVILSACNTASEDGTPNAEGLSGLTSAFFQAGTKSMMVTHWDVETNSAVTLTTGMFDKMKELKNLSKAMHKTKIEMMSDPKTSHPIYWAPFVLIGNVNNSIN